VTGIADDTVSLPRQVVEQLCDVNTSEGRNAVALNRDPQIFVTNIQNSCRKSKRRQLRFLTRHCGEVAHRKRTSCPTPWQHKEGVSLFASKREMFNLSEQGRPNLGLAVNQKQRIVGSVLDAKDGDIRSLPLLQMRAARLRCSVRERQ
jgi:hypothetical protein